MQLIMPVKDDVATVHPNHTLIFRVDGLEDVGQRRPPAVDAVGEGGRESEREKGGGVGGWVGARGVGGRGGAESGRKRAREQTILTNHPIM